MKHLTPFFLLIVVSLATLILSTSIAAASNKNKQADNHATRYAIITRRSPSSSIINEYPLYYDNPWAYQAGVLQTTSDGILLAHGQFQPTGNQTGWNYFKVTGNPEILKTQQQQMTPKERLAVRNSSDAVLVYRAVGILEGFLMPQEIVDTDINSFWMPTPTAINDFMQENMNFIKHQLCDPSVPLPQNATSYGKNSDDNEYIVQLCKLYAQVEGISEGVQTFIKMFPEKAPWNLNLLQGGPRFTTLDSWTLNSMSSFMDYFVALNISMMMDSETGKEEKPLMTEMLKRKKYFEMNKKNDKNKQQEIGKFHPTPQQEKYLLNEHCSALVKVTQDDTLLCHDTWGQFNMFIRKFATVELETTIQFSGYPGVIASVDDFLINDHNGIIVTETTFQQGNAELTQKYVTPWTVPEFMRSVTATLLAKNGQEWSRLFVGELNDGTYCNSWIILTKSLVSKTTSGVVLQDGAVYLSENMPGPYSVSQDITHIVRSQNYWPGYNVPYAPSVFNLSGALALQQQYGSYFSFDHCARANIFRRDSPKVTDMDSMIALMRSNNYKTDPLSVIPGCIEAGCNPVYSPTLDVAARGDLSPANQTFGNLSTYMAGFFGPSAFAALDVKCTSVFANFHPAQPNSGLSQTFSVKAQSGPTTFDGLPPLVLPNLASDLQMVTYGQYQGAWEFPFVEFSSNTQPTPVHKKNILGGLKKH